jgi:hypothetical protein
VKSVVESSVGVGSAETVAAVVGGMGVAMVADLAGAFRHPANSQTANAKPMIGSRSLLVRMVVSFLFAVKRMWVAIV